MGPGRGGGTQPQPPTDPQPKWEGAAVIGHTGQCPGSKSEAGQLRGQVEGQWRMASTDTVSLRSWDGGVSVELDLGSLMHPPAAQDKSLTEDTQLSILFVLCWEASGSLHGAHREWK
jgi:hypothetical protein